MKMKMKTDEEIRQRARQGLQQFNQLNKNYQELLKQRYKEIQEEKRELEQHIKKTKNEIRKWDKILLWISPLIVIFTGIITYLVSKQFYNELTEVPKDYLAISLYGFIMVLEFGLFFYNIFQINVYRKRVRQDKIDILNEIVEELTDKNEQEN